MARQFTDILGDLASGSLVEDLTARLAEVTSAVMDTRKAGEITIKLAVKANGENSVMVTPKVTSKAPEPPLGESLFFTTADGSLVRSDPRQDDLPLKVVDERSAG